MLRFNNFLTIILFSLLMGSGCAKTPVSEQRIVTKEATLESYLEHETSDFLHVIHWNDDNEVDGSISLFYDTDSNGFDGKLIVQDIPVDDPANVYYWNTSNLPDGKYFLYMQQQVDGESNSYYLAESVNIRHANVCLYLSNRTNLLPNPGFEDGDLSLVDQLIGDDQWGFNITSIKLSERSPKYAWENRKEFVFEGDWSIRIWDSFNGVNSSSAWEDRAILRSPIIDLPNEDAKYLLTANIMTENVHPGHVLLRIKYFDGKGDQLSLRGHGTDTFYFNGSNNSAWDQLAVLINPPHWNSPPYPENARAKKIEIGISLDNSPGTLWVDNVSLVEISPEEFDYFYPGNWYAAPEITTSRDQAVLPQIEGWSTSVQQDPSSGVWWFVGPRQNAFWGIGTGSIVNHKIESFTGDPESFLKQQSQVKSKYELNFNLGWRDFEGAESFSDTRNHIVWLNFSSQPDIEAEPSLWVLKDRDGKLIDNFGHFFPDVFSPIWQEYAVQEAETLLSNDGWKLTSEDVIGYWTDNEIAYGDVYDFLWGDVAKLAFIDWLQGKNNLPSVDREFAKFGSVIDLNIPEGFELSDPYQSPEDLNASWSSSFHKYRYSSFQDVIGKDKPFIRSHEDPVKDDLYKFVRVIYKLYVDTIISNIRKVENDFIQNQGRGFHRPIFSNRFHLNSPAAIEALQSNMDIFSDFDVIAVNWYPSFNQSGTYHPLEWMQLVKETFHDPTGKPIFISEFGVAAEDGDDFSITPYLFVARWRDKTVPYQYQRGWMYANLLSTWANLPYVIGAQWYSWGNQYGDSPFDDVRNSGLVDDKNNYYFQLTDNVRSINKQLLSIERKDNFSLDQIDWSKVELNICAD